MEDKITRVIGTIVLVTMVISSLAGAYLCFINDAPYISVGLIAQSVLFGCVAVVMATGKNIDN